MEHNVYVFHPFILMGHLLQYFFDQRQCFAFTDIVPRFQRPRLQQHRYCWPIFQAMAVILFFLGGKVIRPYCFSLPAAARISLVQSWTKVLGTVLQYSYYSVFSRFPHKTAVQRLRNFLAVLPSPTLNKVETRKRVRDTRVQHCLWTEGRGWTRVRENVPKMQKCPKTFVHDCLKMRWEEKRQF